MPNMSKMTKNWLFPGDIQSSRKFLEDSRNDAILNLSVENQVSWQKLSGINTLHIESSQNWQIPGHFWNPGILDSRV